LKGSTSTSSIRYGAPSLAVFARERRVRIDHAFDPRVVKALAASSNPDRRVETRAV